MRNKRDLQQRLHLCRGMDACTFSSLELSVETQDKRPTSLTCISNPPLSSKDPYVGIKRKHTHSKKQSQLGLILQVSVRATWGQTPLPKEAVMATEQSSLTANISSSTSISSSIPYQGESCQHTLRKEVNCTHVKI